MSHTDYASLINTIIIKKILHTYLQENKPTKEKRHADLHIKQNSIILAYYRISVHHVSMFDQTVIRAELRRYGGCAV